MVRRERIHLEVNDETISAGDSWLVMKPVRCSVTIYDGPGMYEHSFGPFSLAQRHVFAVCWYVSEVSNGGHEQFYSNSTGVVWKDARDGFLAIGLPQAAAIINVSADRLGGDPSLDRDERQDQLEQEEPDFADCDEALESLLEKSDLESLLMTYIRSRPADFYFSGEVPRSVFD